MNASKSVRRALLAALRLPLRILRTTLVVAAMAVVRALGGRLRIPPPAPRNLPGQVEKKK